MNRSPLGLLLAACALFFTGCNQLPSARRAPNEGATIADVVLQVKNALAQVRSELPQGSLPDLSSVKLSLQTVATRTDHAGLQLLVVTAGGSLEQSETQRVDLTFAPPAARALTNAEHASIGSALEAAILSAAQGISDAAAGDVKLGVSSLQVEIQFVVKASATAGLKPVIELVTLDLGSAGSLGVTQTLTVTFANRPR